MPHRKISEHLLLAFAKRIIEGSWNTDRTVPAARELAKLFGVARATIDAVVGEAVAQGLLVTEARRGTRVAAGAAGRARVLLGEAGRSRRAVRIAVFLPESRPGAAQDVYHQTLARHLGEQAHKRGWTVEGVLWPVAAQDSFPRLLDDRRFDGAFCIMAQPERLMPLYFMRQRSFPVVVYNHKVFDLPLPTVMFDEYASVQELGRLLHGLGHRRICLLAGPGGAGDAGHGRQVAGWLDFCREHELLDGWDEPVYFPGHPDPQCAVRAYFRRRPLPTAVIFGSGVHLNAFFQLGDIGLRVPEDMSVAASHCLLEDRPEGRYPAITSTRPNLRRVAECSMELLARMIGGEPYPPPIRLPYILARSESIGPPRMGEI
jgi:LacI family transcriptional regulator